MSLKSFVHLVGIGTILAIAAISAFQQAEAGSGTVNRLNSNVATADALAANPTDCAANQFATTIAASGNLTCAALADADVPNALTIDSMTITAGDLAAGSCTLGQVRRDTGGATVELCFCFVSNQWTCISATTTNGPTN